MLIKWLEPIVMEISTYVMPPEPISTAYIVPLVSNTNITAFQIAEANAEYFLNAYTSRRKLWMYEGK
jgi:hypothetical protein